MAKVILRTTSHRSREKLHAALGRKPQYLWDWDHGGGFAEVTEEEARRVLPIKGVTRARVDRSELYQCW